LLIAAIWGEIGNQVFWRGTGVVLVLTAASAVTVPVLHRLAGIPRKSDPVHERSVEHCPYCGSGVHGPHATRLVCGSCGESFRVLH
jgi:ribosomal protein S27AE